jgi:predicted RNA binding protein YcfA (HicA-like mRNA interferase family)
MQLRTQTSTTTVPVPDHGTVATGTLLSIIRQSSIGRAPFET